MKYMETLRSFRIGKYAIFDFVASLSAGYAFGAYTGLINPYLSSLLTIPLGIVVHSVLKINTPLNRAILQLYVQHKIRKYIK